jgi:hypothetical protein
MFAPIVYDERKKTFVYEYTPKFYLDPEIVRILNSSPHKNNGGVVDEFSSLEEENDLLDDKLESEELDEVSGGSNDKEWFRSSEDEDSDVILDDGIDFNGLFIDDNWP